MFYFRSGNYATERQYYVYTLESFVADVGGYLVVCGATIDKSNCELLH